MSLKEAIKSEARHLGFQLVGITTPEPPPHFDVFANWLDEGRHGEMGYLAAERSRVRRADPRLILPECKSILVLGIRHTAPGKISLETRTEADDMPVEDNFRGRVAAYAWGKDYHDVLPEHLAEIVSFIESQVGGAIPNRWYTDTGPLLERDLAQRAGLGWIGKNTCLINPRAGSYFILAEILLGIELEPDKPFAPDHCGSCTRCLDACPTSCILPDRTIDARRCISYLTIELKGSIPLELRTQIGDWAFGCDVCQQVCPWNLRFSTPDGDPAFAPRPGVPDPDLVKEISLSAQEFNTKFKDSPLKRTKRRGYLRNIAIALGNAGDPSAVLPLSDVLLDDPEPLIRSHAAWALGQINNNSACQALNSALSHEKDALVIPEINHALRNCR